MNKQPQTNQQHATTALDRARRLSESRPDAAQRTIWFAQAAHFGDLSVLALALSKR